MASAQIEVVTEGDKKPKHPMARGLTFDEALTKYVGEFGKGQVRIFLLGSLAWVPNAILILMMVFANRNPLSDRQWHCTDPSDAACKAVWDASSAGADFCAMSSSQWAWDNPTASVISEFNLICSESWKSQLANSFFFLGYLIGSGVFGSLADSHGRKPSLFGSTAIGATFTILCIACTNYWALMVLRLLTGIGAAGMALASYIVSTEPIGPSWRGAAGIATQLFFILGEFVLVILAFIFGTWRSLAIACAVVCASFLVLWPVVPESARWQLVRGDKQAATAGLTKIAAANHTRLPLEPLADAPKPAGGKLRIGDILKDKHISRRFFILAYVWMVMCMTYYGISFALGSLGGSLYISFAIGAIAEIPSYLLAGWAIERIGRHNTMAAGLLLGGVACVGCAFCPTGAGQTVLAAVGKFGVAASFAIASIYTSELFPTLVRSAVLGAENQAARVGGIVAPFIVLAGNSAGGSASLVPFLTFGLASVLAGLLIFTLPETLGVALPDTMQDMGDIRSIFTNETWKHGWKAVTASMFKTKVVQDKKQPLPRPTEEHELIPAVRLEMIPAGDSSINLAVGLSDAEQPAGPGPSAGGARV